MSSIKQVLIFLRDPNSVAVRPSGFDCVRLCHSERSGAESNCEAVPSKAKVESRAVFAQDDTQDGTPTEKSKGVRTICSCSFLHTLPTRYSVSHLIGVLSGGNITFSRWGRLFLRDRKSAFFLTSTAVVDTKVEPRTRRGENYDSFCLVIINAFTRSQSSSNFKLPLSASKFFPCKSRNILLGYTQ